MTTVHSPIPADAEAFEVRYSEAKLSPPRNSFRFSGRGELRLSADAIEVSGRARGFFHSKPAQVLRFPLHAIVNVQHSGHALRFNILEEGRHLHLQVWLAEKETVRRLADRLPATRTQEFEKAQGELSGFLQRLHAVSPRAPITPFLIGANILVFIGMALNDAGVMTANPEVHVRWGSNYGPLTYNGEAWRLFTSTFIHFGVLHVALNMWALYAYGPMTERLFGTARFVLLYVFAGLAGSIASVLWNPLVNSAGASGAIFGVFGGMFAFLTLRATQVPMAIVTSHRNSLLVFLGYNLFLGFAHPGIDNAAHLGGLAGGFVAGLVLARPVDPEHRRSAASVRVAALALAGTVVLWAALVGIGSWRLQPTMTFRVDLLWFSYYEDRILDVYNAFLKDSRASKLSDADSVRILETDVLPFWNKAAQRFGTGNAEGSEDLRRYRDGLGNYVLTRQQSVLAHIAAIRDPSEQTLEEFGASFRAAETAAKDLKALEFPVGLRGK